MEDFEAKFERLAEERDSAERAMSQAYYLITGKSPEWSNIFGYEEALEEINTAQYLLRTEIASFKRLEREQETEPMPHDDQVFTMPEFERNNREA